MDMSFKPSIWLEEAAPNEVVDCQKCELHCQRPRVIWGEGNPNAPIMVILDNPGEREDKEGNPYVCGTRQTLQQAAFNSGIKAEDLYVTYILKCSPKRKYDKEVSRESCLGYLNYQISLKQPKLVFCLGNVAVQSFFKDIEAEVKNLRGQWHLIRNIPTAVSYHPLAVRRRPNLLKQFKEDWELLAIKLKDLM